MRNHQKIAALEASQRKMREWQKTQPLRKVGEGKPSKIVLVGRGNTLVSYPSAGPIYGLKSLVPSGTGTPLATIPKAAPDATDYASGVFSDGLAVGQIVYGGTLNTYVWIGSYLTDIGGANILDSWLSYPQAIACLLGIRASVQISGQPAGTTAPVYLISRSV